MRLLTSLFTLIIAIHSLSAQTDSTNVLPPLAGEIQINKNQLLINGTPFIIKGTCYNPVRKGEMFPDGLMTLNPTAEDLTTIEQDFQQMTAAGFNTLRTYMPIVNSSVLALLTKYNLRTIIPICPSLSAYQNLTSISNTIDLLKNEPSTLIWEIGNEWNYNHFYTYLPGQDVILSNKQCLDMIEQVALLVRQHDPKHPIATDIAIPPKYQTVKNANVYRSFPACVDLIGVNSYCGLRFGSQFNTWNQIVMEKPFYLGECGADAWNQTTNSYDPEAQNKADISLFTIILNNLSANNPDNILVGGCIFEWCDEWWKEGFPATHDMTGSRSANGSGPYPDHFYNNEWFGIVDIDRNPRPAYYALQKLLKKQPSQIEGNSN